MAQSGMKYIRASTLADVSALLAETTVAKLSHAVARNGSATMAIAGGNSPRICMQLMAKKKLAWSQVAVTLTDERCVSRTDSRSNENLLKTQFFINNASCAQFIPLYDEALPLSENMVNVQDSLQPFANGFDVCILGMGEDGHIASLFPDSAQLNTALTSSELAVAVTSESVPEQRISLTLSCICRARFIALLVSGEKKRQLLETGNAERGLPVDILLASSEVHIFQAQQ